MPDAAKVLIHPTQFPDRVRHDLLQSFRSRRMNHKFHYDSIKQTNQWLALHEAFSPYRTDPDCSSIYDQAFADAASRLEADSVHLIGLGCGGGRKDTQLLRLLEAAGRKVFYTPSDVSPAMVLVARQTALAVVDESRCFPFVCDLAGAEDVSTALDAAAVPPGTARVLTFFGMIPNFEPSVILPKLASLTRPGDLLLFSANLAPGSDYVAGIKKVLPLYDNALTREWLMTVLLDAGVERDAGRVEFRIEPDPSGGPLMRIAARFVFVRESGVRIGEEEFKFRPGEEFQLFFSYRHTPALIGEMLAQHGLSTPKHWVNQSGEEGVFLVLKTR